MQVDVLTEVGAEEPSGLGAPGVTRVEMVTSKLRGDRPRSATACGGGAVASICVDGDQADVSVPPDESLVPSGRRGPRMQVSAGEIRDVRGRS